MEILKPPMQNNFVSNNVAENWRRFERQFRVYYVACEIATKSGPTQLGILLHTAGPEAQDVHESSHIQAMNNKMTLRQCC